MSTRADIVVEQGTTFSTSVNLTDNNGLPLNLTGYSANSAFKKWYTSNTSYPISVTIAQPNNGIITLSLTSNQTGNVWFGRYVYDVIIQDASNNITRVVEGVITITPGVVENITAPT